MGKGVNWDYFKSDVGQIKIFDWSHLKKKKKTRKVNWTHMFIKNLYGSILSHNWCKNMHALEPLYNSS